MLDTQEDLLRSNKQKEHHILKLILINIDNYKNNKLGLNALIKALESLLNSLEEREKEWEDLYRGYHWELEREYAFFVVDKKTSFSKEELETILQALESIEKLVQEKIKFYEPYLEDTVYE